MHFFPTLAAYLCWSNNVPWEITGILSKELFIVIKGPQIKHTVSELSFALARRRGYRTFSPDLLMNQKCLKISIVYYKTYNMLILSAFVLFILLRVFDSWTLNLTNFSFSSSIYPSISQRTKNVFWTQLNISWETTDKQLILTCFKICFWLSAHHIHACNYRCG